MGTAFFMVLGLGVCANISLKKSGMYGNGGLLAACGWGYAINPTRDFMPRLVQAIMPIKNKGSSNFDYAWVPVLRSVIGAILAAWLYKALF